MIVLVSLSLLARHRQHRKHKHASAASLPLGHPRASDHRRARAAKRRSQPHRLLAASET